MFKGRRFHLTRLMVFIFSILSFSVVAAQNSPQEQPLLQMLMNVPDNATSRSEIYFNDRKAVEAAYPSAKMPTDWAAFQAYRDDKGQSDSFKPVDLWWKVWRNQQSSLMSRYMNNSDEMSKAVGFDFFSIQQEMNYGQPPHQTLQLNGTFDLDKVRAALTAQGYTRQDQAGVEVWCGPDGCDSGAKMSIKDRNPANPFGGDLGRKWPIVIQGNSLIGSPDATVIQNHVAVSAGNSQSLGDAPEYQAAVGALTQNGVLMQAYFWDGNLLAAMSDLDPAIIGLAPAQRKRVLAEILKDYEPLPVFKLLAFGDIANEKQAGAEVALVYSSQDDANKAAEIIPKRIDVYQSLVVRKSLKDLLAERGVNKPDVQVVESSGQYVVLITFATAKATNEQLLAMKALGDNPDGIAVPGLVYQFFIASAMRRDLSWLSTIPREILEAAAK